IEYAIDFSGAKGKSMQGFAADDSVREVVFSVAERDDLSGTFTISDVKLDTLGKATFSIELKNTSEGSAALLAALYDTKTKELIWCGKNDIELNEKTKTVTFKKVPEIFDDTELKVFIWDSLVTMDPIFSEEE
ncbi:MAG: hypothetical protein IKB93_06450, partial [Clostridia bacterium]|nr:hypothetical protein [Clostridia bacterium]